MFILQEIGQVFFLNVLCRSVYFFLKVSTVLRLVPGLSKTRVKAGRGR